MSEKMLEKFPEKKMEDEKLYKLVKVGHLGVGDHFVFNHHEFKIVWHELELFACVCNVDGVLRLSEFKAQQQVFVILDNPMNHVENI